MVLLLYVLLIKVHIPASLRQNSRTDGFREAVVFFELTLPPSGASHSRVNSVTGSE